MPANNNTAPLEVTGICKSYGSLRALQDVSFRLQKGTCGLLGPNGAGKTTACHILCGLHKEDSGQVLVQGLSYDKSRNEILSQIGVQLQESRFYEKFTIEETFRLCQLLS